MNEIKIKYKINMMNYKGGKLLYFTIYKFLKVQLNNFVYNFVINKVVYNISKNVVHIYSYFFEELVTV